MSELQASKKSLDSEYSLSHDVDQSEDEHFSDASEGHQDQPIPIPITRVEKTDGTPSHGEIPGTPAHDMRKQDAPPDELEVVPEATSNQGNSPSQPVPRTIVEKVDPSSPSNGEVPGTVAHDIRQADAEPDEVLKAPDSPTSESRGSPTMESARSTSRNPPTPTLRRAEKSTIETQVQTPTNRPIENRQGVSAVETPAQGDDFDDFNEGSDGDDFGAFDGGEQSGGASPSVDMDRAQHQVHDSMPPSIPVLDVQSLSTPDDFAVAEKPFLEAMFPGLQDVLQPGTEQIPESNTSFLTERSQSLWSQLVAPPPLQPPNWIRSRIRRLFLVSLGVPVDLDEILPASKQNKLILPSFDLEHDDAPSRVDDSPSSESITRLKQKNNSSTSVNSTLRPDRKRRGPPPPPDLDINATRLLCSTTAEALGNLTTTELRSHNERLETLSQKASEALAYWLVQRDSANDEKEAFEEVIENLVRHAQKFRK